MKFVAKGCDRIPLGDKIEPFLWYDETIIRYDFSKSKSRERFFLKFFSAHAILEFMNSPHKSDLHAYCDPRLKTMACDEADRLGLTVSELLVWALVEFIDAPEELKVTPRLPLGRPPAKKPHLTLNGKKAEAG